MHKKPIDVTDNNFQAIVLEADKPVVVDFWAEWCAPCHTVSIWMENLAKAYGDKLIVTKVNADQNPEAITAQEILGLPLHRGRRWRHDRDQERKPEQTPENAIDPHRLTPDGGTDRGERWSDGTMTSIALAE